MSDNSTSFSKRLWHEAEPLVTHGVIVVLLLLILTVIGLSIENMKHVFPGHADYLTLLEKGDIWVAAALLAMFGAYTLIRVAFRLFSNLKEEVIRPQVSITAGNEPTN